MSEEGKSRAVTGDHPQPPPFQYDQHYGTFQGVAATATVTYPYPHPHPPPPHPPVIGFPQPVPPAASAANGGYYLYGYQSVPPPSHNVNIHWNPVGHGVAEGSPVREHTRPSCCSCNIGLGWFLFIMGFFFAAFPWYLGAGILLFVRVEHREKPGYVACTIAAILALIATSLGVTKATLFW